MFCDFSPCIYIAGNCQDSSNSLVENTAILLDQDLQIKDSQQTHPVTDLKNLVALSTTSSQTEDTVPSSNSVASGSARSASKDSCSSSLQRSASSPAHKQPYH